MRTFALYQIKSNNLRRAAIIATYPFCAAAMLLVSLAELVVYSDWMEDQRGLWAGIKENWRASE